MYFIPENLRNFMAWPAFTILSRLAYGVYITHSLILERYLFSQRNPMQYDMFNLVSTYDCLVPQKWNRSFTRLLVRFFFYCGNLQMIHLWPTFGAEGMSDLYWLKPHLYPSIAFMCRSPKNLIDATAVPVREGNVLMRCPGHRT